MMMFSITGSQIILCELHYLCQKLTEKPLTGLLFTPLHSATFGSAITEKLQTNSYFEILSVKRIAGNLKTVAFRVLLGSHFESPI